LGSVGFFLAFWSFLTLSASLHFLLPSDLFELCVIFGLGIYRVGLGGSGIGAGAGAGLLLSAYLSG
jgi:hypothetical protein